MRRLITLPLSHYCEMARWALDRTGVPWREERHLQMFSRLTTRRLARYDHVPLLLDGERAVGGSAAIVRDVDALCEPSRRLFPEATDEPLEALLIDFEGYGVQTRRWAYGELFKMPTDVIMRFNNDGAPLHERAAVRVSFRMMEWFLRSYLEVDDDRCAAALDDCRALWDRVAAMLDDGRPYLRGDRFTVADLSFISMSTLVSLPERYGAVLFDNHHLPETFAAARAEFLQHPAGAWAAKVFDAHRGIPSTRPDLQAATS